MIWCSAPCTACAALSNGKRRRPLLHYGFMKAIWLGITRSPHIVYLVLAVIFTSAFIVIIPPMTTPDAPQHFMRAYAISVGKLVPSEQGPGIFSNSLTDESTYNLEVGFQPTSEGYYLPQSIVAYAMGAEYATGPLATSTGHPGEAFVYENQTEGTSPVAYLPQVLALFIGRPFTDSPTALAYLQEMMLAVIWIAGMTMTIRIAPFGKWPLLLIALLPTQIQDSFQLGADVMTSLPLALMTALLIRRVSCARRTMPGTITEFTLMSGLAVLTTQAKVVMLPVVLLLLAYPLGFTYIGYSKGTFLASLWKRLLGVVPAIAGALLWSWCAQSIGRGLHDVYVVAPDRLNLFASAPIGAFVDWLRSCMQWVCNQFDYPGLICVLKSGDVRIPNTIALVALFAIAVMICTHNDRTLHSVTSAPENAQNSFPETAANLSRASRLAINMTCIITVFGILAATLLSMYVIWTPIGAYGLLGVQSRYLLPCLYVLAMLVPPEPFRASDMLIRGLCIITASALFLISLTVVLH